MSSPKKLLSNMRNFRHFQQLSPDRQAHVCFMDFDLCKKTIKKALKGFTLIYRIDFIRRKLPPDRQPFLKFLCSQTCQSASRGQV